MVVTPARRFWKCVLFFYLALPLLLPPSRAEQTAVSSTLNPTSVIALQPGHSIRRELSAGQQETFEISMGQGQLLRFSIQKGDLALNTEAYNPTGTRILEQVSHGFETVESSLLSETAGSYRIVIQSLERVALPRRYELSLHPVAVLTTQDRLDHEARKLMAAATILRAHWTKTSLNEAIDKYDKAALVWKESGNFSNAAHALTEAGEVCFLLSQYNDALKRYRTAEQMIATTANETRARALGQIGLLLSYIGKNDEAQVHLDKALRLLEPVGEGQGLLVQQARAEVLSNQGEVNYSKGNLVKSLAQFEQARRIFGDIGDRNGQANMHLFLGNTAGSLGQPQKAVAEIRTALKLFREVSNKAGEGRALIASGLSSSLKRDEDGAIVLHRDALEIFQGIGDRHSEAIALTALGQAYENLSEYSISLDNYQKALNLFQKVGALDLASVAMCKVGAVYRLAANLDQALSHYQRCIDMSRAAGKLRTEAIALEEVGTIYAAQGQLEQTQRQYQKLQSFYERLGDIRGQASALNSKGDSFLLIGQRERALAAYSRALPLSEEAGDTGVIVSTLYNLARVYRDLGLLEPALAHIDRSLKIVEDVRRNVGSPDIRASYFSGMHKHYDLRIDILMQLDRAQPDKGFAIAAFLTSENARARSLLDLLAETRADLRRAVAPEMLNRERELQGLLRAQAEYLMELSIRGRDYREMAEVTAEIDRLRSDYLELQSHLNDQNQQRLAIADSASLTLEQVQKELRPDTMLLEFALGDVRSYVWVVTHDSFRGYELPAGKVLQDEATEVYKLLTARQDLAKLKADDYTTKVEAADSLYLEQAAKLSEKLLGQLAEQLAKSKRLVIVTEGPLQYISFEGLPIPPQLRERLDLRAEDVGFLIATHEIVRLPSISTLIGIRNTARRPPSANNIIAVFADPVFSTTDERVNKEATVSEAGDALETNPFESVLPVVNGLADKRGPVRLSHTANEANAILAVSPAGTALVAEGFEASREMAMSSRIGQFQIVHFATHSVLNSERPELSGIVLTMVDPNGTKKNGIMLLPDIYSLDLSAELTVLSACETALGKELSGEGLIGFTHSFLSAGSKSIVASLWKVDDRPTAILMADFYKSMLQQGMAPAAALRAAKLNLMKEQRWRAPYFWASFVFQGEYENRIAVKKNAFPRPVMIIVPALFAIVAGVMLYRRYRRQNNGQ
jgi:CHAT domain-containing protein/tetratricopeptide (TPR) repeat protein